MDRGKFICKTLKELRKRIADANGIPYEIEECLNTEPCPGTCPKCEAEVRYIENAIKEKQLRGESANVEDLMAEEELRTALTDSPEPIEPILPAGIPAPPCSIRARLEEDITEGVLQCIKLSSDYPKVGLFISEVNYEVLWTRYPELEAEALDLMDCKKYDWRSLIKCGLPSENAIRELAMKLVPDDNEGLDDDDTEPLLGEIAPLHGIVKMTYADNRTLTKKLLEKLIDKSNAENILFSPLGACSILEMLLCGVTPESPLGERITRLLDGFSMEDFESISGNDDTLQQATSLWYDRNRCHVKESFRQALSDMFATQPFKMDFSLVDNTREKINHWVVENTHGMIKQLDLNLTYDTFMVLIDALYLKANWSTPFPSFNTKLCTFYNSDDSKSQVKMMNLISDEVYYEGTKDYQSVELEYRGGDMSMIIILPRKGKNLVKIMLDADWLDVNPDDNYEVDLFMPKFKFDLSLDLKDTLSSLGLGDLFDNDEALSGITDEPAHVSGVKQQCVIAVDENGTEAAAVTYLPSPTGCPPADDMPKRHQMVVDRPFGFAIKYCNNTILFMGVVSYLDDAEQVATISDEPKIHELKKTRKPNPAEIKQRLTTITVAGTSHIKGLKDIASEIDEGTQLSLRHERDNKYDRNAIGVYLDTERVGYIPKEKNEILANLLDADIPLRAIVTEAEWRGNWFCIKADIVIINVLKENSGQ